MKQLLNGIWNMQEIDSGKSYSAKIPGSMYRTYLDHGVIDDPFYRDNENKLTSLSNKDYLFETTFIVDNQMLLNDKVELVFEGIDTLATIFLNDEQVAKTDNMHIEYVFNVKDILKDGENHLKVIIDSPTKYIEEKDSEYKLFSVSEEHALQGYGHIRKAHCMFGWDWGPKLPDMGIWKDVYLRGNSNIRIEDVYIKQVHKENMVDVIVNCEYDVVKKLDYIIKVAIYSKEGDLVCEETTTKLNEQISLAVEKPELWWPNGLGEQPLYNVVVDVLLDNEIISTNTKRIGLRTLEVCTDKDEWGTQFAFVVNNVPFFSMGADYIPEDSILSRHEKEKTKRLIEDCVEANFNSIRVWGGGYYPHDDFFELCDEYGLVVWQDLMYACATYRITDEFEQSIREEARQNIKRIRNHPSLGLICGNNEMEWGWCEWGFEDNISKKERQKADYIKQFEYILKQESENLTDILYWPASPSSFGSFEDPNSPNHGDVHDWTVWHKNAPFTYYRTTSPRYLSEFGMQSFPCIETVKTFAKEEDMNIFSKVMENHQKNEGGNNKILSYIAQYFKYPHGFDNLLYISQLIQGEAIKYAVEHFRRIRGRCMGAIYWQLNDCWPVASWSSIDYENRWKALHYYAKRFFSQVLCSVEETKDMKASIHVSNEKREKFNGVLKQKLWVDDIVIYQDEKEVDCNAMDSICVTEMDYSNMIEEHKKEVTVLEYELFNQKGKLVSYGTCLFTRAKHFRFKEPKIQLDLKKETSKYTITLISNTYVKGFEMKVKDHKIVLSDNYFDMVKDKEYAVSFVSDEKVLLSDIKIRSVYDTYEKF